MNDKNPIVIGFALIIAGPISAFCGAAAFGLMFGMSFTALFYGIWGVETVIGVLAIVGGIKDRLDKRKSINS